MKNLSYILVAIAVVALIFATLRPHKTHIPPLTQQVGEVETKNVSELTTNSDERIRSFTGNSNSTKRLPNYEQTAQSYIEGKNKSSLDLYGLVIDQYGEPVAGAKIRGAIGYNISFVSSSGEFRYTETDLQGRFNFLGIHGAGIGLWPEKAGYYYNPKLPSNRPDDYVPNPANPLKLVMWKIKGVEPMQRINFESRIPYDGTWVSFDLQTGKKANDGNGELKIYLTRTPQSIPPGLLKPYDWEVKIEITDGGIVEETDLYPFWASEDGYEKLFEATMSSNSVPWQAEFSRNFYIKNARGQYGFLRVDISTNSKRSDTGIKVEAAINISGSRNLEPDFMKLTE